MSALEPRKSESVATLISTRLAPGGTLQSHAANVFTQVHAPYYGHSKKLESHVLALGLHFFGYNYCRKHLTIKTAPAVAADVTDKIWSVQDLLDMFNAYQAINHPIQFTKNYKHPARLPRATSQPQRIKFRHRGILTQKEKRCRFQTETVPHRWCRVRLSMENQPLDFDRNAAKMPA
jgi:hypothetical protein